MTIATDLDRLAIDTIRTLSIDGVQKANSGRPGAPWAPRRWRTSCGRGSCGTPGIPTGRTATGSSCPQGTPAALLSSLSTSSGKMQDLQAFRQWGSRTPGHRVRPDTGRRGSP